MLKRDKMIQVWFSFCLYQFVFCCWLNVGLHDDLDEADNVTCVLWQGKDGCQGRMEVITDSPVWMYASQKYNFVKTSFYAV